MKIYINGHSAGATHVASYIFDKSLQPAEGRGRRRRGADQRLATTSTLIRRSEWQEHAGLYFGDDPACASVHRSITSRTGEAKVPVFVVVTEYDNPGLDIRGAELLAALCARDSACPRFIRPEKHNHQKEVRLQQGQADRETGFHGARQSRRLRAPKDEKPVRLSPLQGYNRYVRDTRRAMTVRMMKYSSVDISDSLSLYQRESSRTALRRKRVIEVTFPV